MINLWTKDKERTAGLYPDVGVFFCQSNTHNMRRKKSQIVNCQLFFVFFVIFLGFLLLLFVDFCFLQCREKENWPTPRKQFLDKYTHHPGESLQTVKGGLVREVRPEGSGGLHVSEHERDGLL